MVQSNLSVIELGNMTVKGQSIDSLINMAKSQKETSSTNTIKPRVNAQRMRAIKLEAKEMMKFVNVNYQTALKKAKDLTKPEIKIIHRRSSKRHNYGHFAKVKVYSQV